MLVEFGFVMAKVVLGLPVRAELSEVLGGDSAGPSLPGRWQRKARPSESLLEVIERRIGNLDAERRRVIACLDAGSVRARDSRPLDQLFMSG